MKQRTTLKSAHKVIRGVQLGDQADEFSVQWKEKGKMLIFDGLSNHLVDQLLVVAGMFLLVAASAAHAVDVYDGARAPRGLYFLSYTAYYNAEVLTDSSGQSNVDDFGYQNFSQILRLCWYSPDYVLTALIPFGYESFDSFDDSDEGIGDIMIAAGRFLPVRNVDLLPFFAVKLPNGSFDSSKIAKVGSGQWDIFPSFYVHKTINPYTFDGVLKYKFRQENPDTKEKPGNELWVEMQMTRKTGPLRIGPGASWMLGEDKEEDGARVRDSAKQMLSLGAEVYFCFSGWSVTLNYMGDVYSENTTRGHFFKVKLCHKL